MARIRSIHPGLFTDEAFIELSHSARLLFIGLLTECDDNGIFEWKPLTLRIRLFAADNDVRVPAWLDELEKQEIVMQFEADGRNYGAVRNFRKWQRPKKPSCKFPFPPEAERFVGDPDVREDNAERGLALGKMLCEQQDHRCFYCVTEITFHRKKSNSLQIDHKTPISRGGKDDIGNLVATCKPCNVLKANLTEAEFRAKFAPGELRVRHGYEITCSEVVGNQSGVATAEGGGRRKEETGRGNPQTKTESVERVAPATQSEPPPSAPETLSPKKTASQGKVSNLGAVLGKPLPADWVPDDKLCEEVKTAFGMTDEDLQTELPAFHALNVQNGVLSANWNSTFYLFCKRWKEHRDKQAPPRISLTKEPAKRFEPAEADWDRAAKLYAQTGRWPRDHGPDPMSAACRCPKEVLQRYDINLETGERRIPPKVVA